MEETGKIAGLIITILIPIIILSSFSGVISNLIVSADDVRTCANPAYPYECLDNDDGLINWCSNETPESLHCVAPRPIYNVTADLCTNASGVSVTNSTRITACDSTYWSAGIVAYDDVGLTPIETILMGLAVLLLIIGILFSVVFPLFRKQN